MTMSKPARAVGIEISGVNLSYGSTHVLKDIALSIRPGEFFAFLGPSGCGKTTLLRLIAGFAQAQTGQVLLDGQDVAPLPPWKRDVGMVFQSYALWPHMTVAKNVAFGLEERRLPRGEIDRRVAQALELVGLSAFAERRPAQLSGGQQQRVAVARTIAIEPKVLLLDEPLSNLDAKMRVSVRRELRALQQRLGLTTIFVTHDQEEANTICDRIAVMDGGKIQQVGTPMELYEHPANLFVANFLGSANILDEKSGVPIPPGKRLVFRPQHAALSAPESAALRGPVTHREFLGATVRYGVRLGESEVLIETPFQSGSELRSVGDQVGVDLPPRRMLFLPA
ncbi:ABC transporter ATP-binding protein [Reyranella aquatilis]|uniref:ABC transporter ATP-binding protein n=2 Tax=Reyranella aquatilis TaxID=2035356 RepID=A0ABS8KZ31_9HYPH|nr:ABC transporter ATP-binding protein [Reyranella aquatilis]